MQNKIDRMAAYEAPRPTVPERPMREIEISYHGHRKRERLTALIPRGMTLPDIIKYHGRLLARRSDDTYTEATVWPIVEALDADRR